MSALQGIRIIELAEGVAGEYCGKLLADFGAEVIKVERPGGSPTRAMAPIIGVPGPESSGLFAYLNTNKKSVVLDLAAEAQREILHTLIAAADVVIDDHAEGWLAEIGLAAEVVERKHPSVLFCAITPFGYGAPVEWRHAKSLNVFHASGWGFHTPSFPDPARPPLKGPGRFLVDYDAALDAALCIVSSLYWRRHGGTGQFIDVSALEVMVSRCDVVLGRFVSGEVSPSEERTGYDQGGPHGFFRCSDGFVYLYAINRRHWLAMCDLMGEPAWTRDFDQDWLEFAATAENVARFRAHFTAWIANARKVEVSETAQRLGLPLVPVNDASDVARSEQSRFRGFFQRVTHPVLGEALYPTVPYKLSASPAKIISPAPSLGAHTDATLNNLREAAANA